jgi:hypothetical protein
MSSGAPARCKSPVDAARLADHLLRTFHPVAEGRRIRQQPGKRAIVRLDEDRSPALLDQPARVAEEQTIRRTALETPFIGRANDRENGLQNSIFAELRIVVEGHLLQPRELRIDDHVQHSSGTPFCWKSVID